MNKKNTLLKQLLFLILIIFVIVLVSLGIVLPNTIIPVAEKNIYYQLSEPLKFVREDYSEKIDDSNIAYLYVKDNKIAGTINLSNIIRIKDDNEIIEKIKDKQGKFKYNNKTYYYYKNNEQNITRIAITDDSYIIKIKEDILNSTIPIVLITFILIAFILVIWSTLIVIKIEMLKRKIDNIDNSDYDHKLNFKINDEIKSLELAIEDMRLSLKNQENYRNGMYQNISHDFKTPLAVIKSYIEAIEDEVEDKDTALKVIKEQTEKLENKVYSLLYLNKLDYLKEANVEIVKVNMEDIINSEVDKFKWKRKDITFKVNYDKKSKFVGTNEHWETILDNLLNNFMRYAEKEIKITVKQNKIILYNDGSNIDDNLLEAIWTPFRKGIKGEFGLGLSIVKKTLNIITYDIEIKNEKKGVSFIITKKGKK